MKRRQLVGFFLALGFAALFAGSPAWAGITPTPFRTGLFGVAAGQSIRISILNAGGVAGTIAPCMHVWDIAGTLLFERDAGVLAGGTGTFAEFGPVPDDNTPAGTSTGSSRRQVYAEVVFAHDAFPPDPISPPDPMATRILQRRILVTLEVVDAASGRTVLTLPFAAVGGVSPQPFTPPFAAVGGINPVPFRTGLFGVTAGQAIRLSVLNASGSGGLVQPRVRVREATGVLLFRANGAPLPAGGGTVIDFQPVPDDGQPAGGPVPDDNHVQLGVEVELVRAVYPPDPIAPPRFRAADVHLTLEVFDIATGRTIFTMPFAPGRPQPRVGRAQ
jgi:hypothetical protein